ncbi:LysM peptidoglycan-binding domain-containing protein [Variovorax sp. PCZ-1]|uniref:LysM peptidoglycan-binding domain-containing protein n=1 Tax=Variovorax sp. PCZ-1 TaxID=2835533 RepID=UPI001BCCF718|nr:LysM peptidoglycan-binding domain-containing protein [Variovorax sp. PCZ-1]MBS7806450.1 LysM peptidoglycan-binding domain-containing protein [Variovorax sp. PCZ-1]
MRTKHHNTTSILAAALLGAAFGLAPATAQNITTPAQKATAQRVAQAGVALDELAANAPESYTVKGGDTLWAISGLFLKQPWRWPELWGMNINEIRNPHLIYPGQVLTLDKSSGRAVLRAGTASGGLQTVKVSPRTRYSSLADAAIPTLASNLIEPFLAEPILVDEAAHSNAPRFISSDNERVLFAKGDRVYARAALPNDLATEKDSPANYRVYRNAVPLKDPTTGQILAYEAQYLGSAELVRGQSVRDVTGKDGKPAKEIVPATFDIVGNKEEMRAGDRLVPEPKRDFPTYVPRAPSKVIDGVRVMSMYGNTVARAGQNSIVSLNKGAADGLEVGHVLAIIKDGRTINDNTVTPRQEVKLPDERNGLAMVFRTFDKVSYALILQINDGVKVGDRLINPR